MAYSEFISSVDQEGAKFKNIHHLALMWTPNLLNPHKLGANLRHPIGEVFHTKHTQYPIELKEGIEYHIVEHRMFNKLTTVDIVHVDEFPKGFMARLKQLFDRNFYYGHDKYFPKPFKLVNRTFVDKDFDLRSHIENILG